MLRLLLLLLLLFLDLFLLLRRLRVAMMLDYPDRTDKSSVDLNLQRIPKIDKIKIITLIVRVRLIIYYYSIDAYSMFGSDGLGLLIPAGVVAGRCIQLMMMMMMKWCWLLRVVTHGLVTLMLLLVLMMELLHLQVVSLLVMVVMVVVGVVVGLQRRVLGMDRLLQGCAVLYSR